jgi:hypothetical protein
MIWQGITSDRLLLQKKGLHIPDSAHYFKQPNLGSYGVADIAGFWIGRRIGGYRDIFIHVLEIKKDEINVGTFTQALRYCNAVRRMIEQHLPYCRVDYRIDLIGKTIDLKSDFAYISDIVTNVNLFTYKLDFSNGITFSRHWGYHQTNEVLPNVNQFSAVCIDIIRKQIKEETELAF